MVKFVDQHREVQGVESICKELPIAPSTYYQSKASQINPEKQSDRQRNDTYFKYEIARVWNDNHQVYGVRKVWRQLLRKKRIVARCTVERLMRQLGLQGAVRGKVKRTTVASDTDPKPLDLVNRAFRADRPNQLWVSYFYLCFNVVGVRVRCLRHRCLFPDACWPARLTTDDGGPYPRCTGTGPVGTEGQREPDSP